MCIRDRLCSVVLKIEGLISKVNATIITYIFLSHVQGPTGFSQGDDGFSQFATVSAGGGIEYATAIPVAVSSLASDPKKMTIKKVAAPASTVSNDA